MNKTTNLSQICLAHKLFADRSLAECNKLLSRIAKNFEIDHDEYAFSGKFELDQPSKEMAEKLIEDGKQELVGDKDYLAKNDYLRWEIRTIIQVDSKSPYETYSLEDLVEEENDAAEIVNQYYHGSFRFDKDGICSSTGNGATKTKHMRNEVKKIINNWLEQEFGK
ncbi:hypothetical protein [Methylomonas sp. AM2-LC]|uniref:hypothetical protein n=1 Tax=Methylomonas sp. AM2-LC TaxID=3153301 RepID=UPI003266F101